MTNAFNSIEGYCETCKTGLEYDYSGGPIKNYRNVALRRVKHMREDGQLIATWHEMNCPEPCTVDAISDRVNS